MIAGLFAALPPVAAEPEPEPPAWMTRTEWPRLAAFLTARYDEREKGLRCVCVEFGMGACGAGWCTEGCPTCCGGEQDPRDPYTIMRLRELGALRELVKQHTPNREAADPWEHDVDNACTWYGDGDHHIGYEDECDVMRLLAYPFIEHADYNPKWTRGLPSSLIEETP